MNQQPNVTYRSSSEAWTGYLPYLTGLVEQRSVRTVCDIGGGANPVFSLDYIQQRGIEYSVLDISQSELDKAPPEYQKIAADIASPNCQIPDQKFDLVFSKMLAEHICDARQFHTNIRRILKPNGVAVHFFPTLYAPPFVVNWLIPEALSDRLLTIFNPRDRHQHAKFPAYYQWCRGPIAGQFRRLASVGLDVVEYVGFFGHPGYYRRLPGIKQVHRAISSLLLKWPTPLLTSYAYLVVTPSNNASGQTA